MLTVEGVPDIQHLKLINFGNGHDTLGLFYGRVVTVVDDYLNLEIRKIATLIFATLSILAISLGILAMPFGFLNGVTSITWGLGCGFVAITLGLEIDTEPKPNPEPKIKGTKESFRSLLERVNLLKKHTLGSDDWNMPEIDFKYSFSDLKQRKNPNLVFSKNEPIMKVKGENAFVVVYHHRSIYTLKSPVDISLDFINTLLSRVRILGGEKKGYTVFECDDIGFFESGTPYYHAQQNIFIKDNQVDNGSYYNPNSLEKFLRGDVCYQPETNKILQLAKKLRVA